MFSSPKHQQILEAILERASRDRDFRRRLIDDPRAAIEKEFGVSIPERFRIKFIEKEPDVDALVVLPDFREPNGELSDAELDIVAGGVARARMPW